MTKRIYYTCPIKAIYMAKEFGVKFTNDGQIIEEIENIWQFGKKEGYSNFYVAKESESLFKLKEGDLCKNIYDDDMGELCMIEGHGLAIPVADGNEGGWMVVDISEVEILKRNNEHFFMPEVEND